MTNFNGRRKYCSVVILPACEVKKINAAIAKKSCISIIPIAIRPYKLDKSFFSERSLTKTIVEENVSAIAIKKEDESEKPNTKQNNIPINDVINICPTPTYNACFPIAENSDNLTSFIGILFCLVLGFSLSSS